MEKSGSELDLPGFRFHPTEEELLDFYLKKVAHGKKLTFDVIGTLNVYHYDPWDLPGMARIGEREWYFFVPRDRRSGNGGRPNRRTEKGFWKATGSDRPVRSAADPKWPIGLKKTLVFYRGRAPRGSKTDWVMNEYRLPDHASPPNDIVLCKIYRKATSLKELEQRAAVEEDVRALSQQSLGVSMVDTGSSSDQEMIAGGLLPAPLEDVEGDHCKETKEEVMTSAVARQMCLPELQVPKRSFDWTQDPFVTQLRSPWLDHWSPYANLLNF